MGMKRKMTGLGKDFWAAHLIKVETAFANMIEVEIFGIKFETTKDLYAQYEQFIEDNQLPLEKIGAIGGEFTLEITPTSLGNVYCVSHTNGNKINLTPFETW